MHCVAATHTVCTVVRIRYESHKSDCDDSSLAIAWTDYIFHYGDSRYKSTDLYRVISFRCIVLSISSPCTYKQNHTM